MNKRLTSLLLCLCMLVSVFSFSASAVEEHDKAWGVEFPADGIYMWFKPDNNYVSMQNPPDFKWYKVPAAKTYDLIVCSDASLKNVVYKAENIVNNFYNFNYTFETGVHYWWAVRYNTGSQKSAWSDARRFRISPDALEFTLPGAEELEARIPKTHPRIHTTLENLDEFRALADKNGNSKHVKETILANADYIINKGVDTSEPVKYTEEEKNAIGGNWATVFMDTICIPKYQPMITVGYAYLLTGDTKYSDFAIDMLMNVSKWDPKGSTGYNEQSQVHREIMLYMSQVYDWCYNEMTPAQRKTVLDHIVARTTEFQTLGVALAKQPVDSHGWTQIGFLGVTAVAIAGDHPKGLEILQWLLPTYSAVLPPWSYQDGGWSQGNQYWQWSSTSQHEFMAPLATSGILNFYNKAWTANEYKWSMYTFPSGSYGLFGDGQMDKSGAYSISSTATTAYFTKNPEAIWISKSWDEKSVDRIGYYASTVYDESDYVPYDLPQATEFHDIGWVAMLSDLVDKDRIQFGFKSSPYGTFNHSHPDNNAFIIQAYGEKLAIRGGYYPWYMSEHHKNFTHHSGSKNTVTVATAKGQRRQDITATGKLTAFLTHEDFDLCAGDATEAYKGNLDKFERNVIYLRPDMFVIIDELDAAKAGKSQFEWWLNSETPMTVYNGEIKGANITNGAASLDASVYYPKDVTPYYNDIYAVSDMMEYKPENEFADYTVQTRTWFETQPVEKTKMVVTLDVHRTGKQPRFTDVKYEDDYMQMVFEDGSVVIVNLTDDREKLIEAGNISFKGVAVCYSDKTMMLVSGTELYEGGKELVKADKTVSVIMGKNRIGISTYEDNKISVNTASDYLGDIEKVQDVKGNPIGREWGIDMQQADGMATFTCDADNYDLLLNGNEINNKPVEDTAEIVVRIDGKTEITSTIPGYVPVKGSANYAGIVNIPKGKYIITSQSDDISFGGATIGKATYMENVEVKTGQKTGNVIELKQVPVIETTIAETNDQDADADVLKLKLKYMAEAESGELAEGSAVYSNRSWLSGGKGVQYLNKPGQISYYTFDIKEAGTYDIGVKYVAWDHDNAQRIFIINGTEYLVNLPRTDDWGTKPEIWKYVITGTGIYLEPGTYKIGIEPAQGSWNYDYLGLVKR